MELVSKEGRKASIGRYKSIQYEKKLHKVYSENIVKELKFVFQV